MLNRHIAFVIAPVAAVLLVALLAVLSWNVSLGGASGNSITAPDTDGEVGQYTSLTLDGSGKPVVSYFYNTNLDLRVLHCNDSNCFGGDESIATLDTGGDVGRNTSVQLDGAGNPVVSYRDNTKFDVKLLHCNDPNCTGGGESITAPDTGGNVGRFTSLQLDASGNPVISYNDDTNGDLKILHCNDPNCSGGDESITAPDTAGNVGRWTSLQLDATGNPVVSYLDFTNFDLKILHCNDPNCSGGDESITAPDTAGDVGRYTSLQIDAAGNPVVSYTDVTNGDLKILHCNDVNCSGGDESITAPDTAGEVGRFTSLQIDAGGNPIVSYYDGTNGDLKILHCNDVNCSGGGESITAPDTASDVGVQTSLQLDLGGNPVVSYKDRTNSDLKVLHCSDPNCSDVTDTPGLAQGDNNCDGSIRATDALGGLQYVAGLPVNQQPDCPELGDALPAAQPAGDPPDLFGDVDCDDDVDAVDALNVLKFVAALPFTQNEPCTDIGDPL